MSVRCDSLYFPVPFVPDSIEGFLDDQKKSAARVIKSSIFENTFSSSQGYCLRQVCVFCLQVKDMIFNVIQRSYNRKIITCRVLPRFQIGLVSQSISSSGVRTGVLVSPQRWRLCLGLCKLYPLFSVGGCLERFSVLVFFWEFTIGWYLEIHQPPVEFQTTMETHLRYIPKYSLADLQSTTTRSEATGGKQSGQILLLGFLHGNEDYEDVRISK